MALVRSWHKEIHTKLTRPINYGNITGVAITGFFLTLFIISLDITAVIFSLCKRTEFDDILQNKSFFNFIITGILLGYDVLVLLVSSSVLLYVCYVELNCCNRKYCCLTVCGCFFKTLFYLLFGTQEQMHSWGQKNQTEQSTHRQRGNSERQRNNDCAVNHEVIKNNRLPWVLMFSSLAPIFSIAGHSSFILMSWLTDPTQATAVALVDIAVIIFFFTMARQCYAINMNFKIKNKHCKYCKCCILLMCPMYNILKALWFCSCRCTHPLCKICCKDEIAQNISEEPARIVDYLAQELQPTTDYSFTIERDDNQEVHLKLKTDSMTFSSEAFCITFAWSWGLCFVIGSAVVAFWELPIATLSLPTYLFNIFQVLIVVLSLLITYKILSTSEPEVRRFLRSMRESYMRTRNTKVDEKIKTCSKYDDIEAIGDLAGDVVHQYINGKEASTRATSTENIE